jgi:hypothetical protein
MFPVEDQAFEIPTDMPVTGMQKLLFFASSATGVKSEAQKTPLHATQLPL